MSSRIIWQYWETRGRKPDFIEGLHQIARRNSGCEVILVTPKTLHEYVHNVPEGVLGIAELAHKADMIRSMLVKLHGGMWLDSDAIVMKDLNFLFDMLEESDFVCFNDNAALQPARPWVRVNCFLSRPEGAVISEWVRLQHAKFPRTRYGWEEIGTELLHPICLANRRLVTVLPFDLICPIQWRDIEKFEQKLAEAPDLVNHSAVVMLSNATLKKRASMLRTMTCQEIAEGDMLISAIMRAALRGVSVDKMRNQNIRFGNRVSSWFERVFDRKAN